MTVLMIDSLLTPAGRLQQQQARDTDQPLTVEKKFRPLRQRQHAPLP